MSSEENWKFLGLKMHLFVWKVNKSYTKSNNKNKQRNKQRNKDIKKIRETT